MQTTPLAAAAVRDALQHARIGHTIVALGSVPSTMPVAAAAMDDGATRSGLVVTAEEQTAGRGRLGRSWQAPAGQALLMTVALKPPDLPQPLSRLPMLAAVAVVEAIARCAPALDARLAIKWPNDVLLQSAGRVNPGRHRRQGCGYYFTRKCLRWRKSRPTRSSAWASASTRTQPRWPPWPPRSCRTKRGQRCETDQPASPGPTV
ncbi:MAG: hypothetical protein R2854_27485 [Caldilineaceae bacterium]